MTTLDLTVNFTHLPSPVKPAASYPSIEEKSRINNYRYFLLEDLTAKK